MKSFLLLLAIAIFSLVCESRYSEEISNATPQQFSLGGIGITIQTQTATLCFNGKKIRKTVMQRVILTTYFPPPPVHFNFDWQEISSENYKKSIEQNESAILQKNNEISINISKDELTIINPSSNTYELVIFDNLGKIYQKGYHNDKKSRFYLNDFDNRQLLIYVKSNNKKIVKKIIR